MIFVATGTQFPFDRLIRYMDTWASDHDEPVIAQIGDGAYQPQHMQFEQFLGLEDYNRNIRNASVFISHAGMGNIISARENGTPIIVVNRQASLGEHRNDHQTEGLQWMGQLEGVYTASTDTALHALLDQSEALLAASGNSDDNLTRLANFLDQTITAWAASPPPANGQ